MSLQKVKENLQYIIEEELAKEDWDGVILQYARVARAELEKSAEEAKIIIDKIRALSYERDRHGRLIASPLYTIKECEGTLEQYAESHYTNSRAESKKEWKPIDSAPWGKEILLTGESGYGRPHDKFIINGYRERDWHQGGWNDATGTPLSDNGWKPTYWKEI